MGRRLGGMPAGGNFLAQRGKRDAHCREEPVTRMGCEKRLARRRDQDLIHRGKHAVEVSLGEALSGRDV